MLNASGRQRNGTTKHRNLKWDKNYTMIFFRRKFDFKTLWRIIQKKQKVMQNEYYNLIKELSRGKMTVVLDILNNFSIAELEELAVMEWNPYLGETLYNITMLHRKKKLNEQFVFSQENIQVIICLDQVFKESCRFLILLQIFPTN